MPVGCDRTDISKLSRPVETGSHIIPDNESLLSTFLGNVTIADEHRAAPAVVQHTPQTKQRVSSIFPQITKVYCPKSQKLAKCVCNNIATTHRILTEEEAQNTEPGKYPLTHCSNCVVGEGFMKPEPGFCTRIFFSSGFGYG